MPLNFESVYAANRTKGNGADKAKEDLIAALTRKNDAEKQSYDRSFDERKQAFIEKLGQAGLIAGKSAAQAAPDLGFETDRDYSPGAITAQASLKEKPLKDMTIDYLKLQETARHNQAMENKPAKTSGDQKGNLDNMDSLINGLEKDLSGLSGYSGMAKGLFGKLSQGNIEGTQTARIYDQKRPAIAVGLYRALTGDTRLSDADAAARAYPLLPDTGEPTNVQRSKIAFMKRKISERKTILANNGGEVQEAPLPIFAPEEQGANNLQGGLSAEEQNELQVLERKYGRQ